MFLNRKSPPSQNPLRLTGASATNQVHEVWSRWESNPRGLGSRAPDTHQAGPTLREQERDWLSSQHDGRIQSDSGGAVKVKQTKMGTDPVPTDDDRLFRQTVQRLLDSPPAPHDDMKKGAAPKRDAPSSGKGAKG